MRNFQKKYSKHSVLNELPSFAGWTSRVKYTRLLITLIIIIITNTYFIIILKLLQTIFCGFPQ